MDFLDAMCHTCRTCLVVNPNTAYCKRLRVLTDKHNNVLFFDQYGKSVDHEIIGQIMAEGRSDWKSEKDKKIYTCEESMKEVENNNVFTFIPADCIEDTNEKPALFILCGQESILVDPDTQVIRKYVLPDVKAPTPIHGWKVKK